MNQKAPLTTGPQMCGFITHSLEVPIPDPAAPDQPQLSPFGAEIDASLSNYDMQQKANFPTVTMEPPPDDGPAREPQPDAVDDPAPGPDEPDYKPANMLFLSGGSQHGAYGAGILHGWGGGKLPEFQVVTGISTGSILASFAFVGKGDFAVDGYTIASESQLLNVYSKPKDGKPDIGNYMDLIKKGAFADLDPLRTRIKGYLTKAYITEGSSRETTVMKEIARRHSQGRRLYIGAVDVDSGSGTAFNMGDMATRYDTARMQGEPAQMAKWLDCYVSAIIASSSTPMAAPPVFIDNTMFVDGGARFGLFGDTVIRAVRVHASRADKEHAAHVAPRVYAVLNGTMQLPPPTCPKKDPQLCNGNPPAWPSNGQHKDWNILELALRSERVLVNQVYRFSAQSVEGEACNENGCFNFLRINPKELAEFRIALPAPLNAGNESELSCPEWATVDIAVDNPIQFQKRYMRCLIRYGEKKVKDEGWGSES